MENTILIDNKNCRFNIDNKNCSFNIMQVKILFLKIINNNKIIIIFGLQKQNNLKNMETINYQEKNRKKNKMLDQIL